MSLSAEEVRADIERTQERLGATLGVVQDRLTPGGTLRSLRGRAHETGSSLQNHPAEAVGQVGSRVVRWIRRNPLGGAAVALAAGLVGRWSKSR
jgi:Protein of unknown function (DUF3618)